MKFLVLDTWYPGVQSWVYRETPGLAAQPYAHQWRALMDVLFGTSDFYSRNLSRLGHEAVEVILNCAPLQRRWAREHRLKTRETTWSVRLRRGVVPWFERTPRTDWLNDVALAQVRDSRPDVLYVQNMNHISSAFLRSARAYAGSIVGQIACPIASHADFREYDLVLTSFPHYVKQFREAGLASDYLRIGFEPSVLDRVKAHDPAHAVTFVGGLSIEHTGRTRLLEHVAGQHEIDCWGYGAECLDAGSPLRARHHGFAWGHQMYGVLRNSRITLNHHIEVARDDANNMRLYEATGMGCMLLTDRKRNLHELFEPGKEVAVYSSPDECRETIAYYLDHESERRAVAEAGHARTLCEHTYVHRMQELLDILGRHL